MVLMRDKEEKDKQQLNTELKELIRVIDHDKKLKEFMKIKTQERQEDEELVTWRRKKGRPRILDSLNLFNLILSFNQRLKQLRNDAKKEKSTLWKRMRANFTRLRISLASMISTSLLRDLFKVLFDLCVLSDQI